MRGIPDPRQALHCRGMIAESHNTDQAISGTCGKNDFGQVWRQRDDALCGSG
jgi:hypothetical protein